MFRVTARIGFVNGSCKDDVRFKVYARDENDVRKQVTPEYIKTNVTDDWPMPIENVTILKVEAG